MGELKGTFDGIKSIPSTRRELYHKNCDFGFCHRGIDLGVLCIEILFFWKLTIRTPAMFLAKFTICGLSKIFSLSTTYSRNYNTSNLREKKLLTYSIILQGAFIGTIAGFVISGWASFGANAVIGSGVLKPHKLPVPTSHCGNVSQDFLDMFEPSE